MLSLGEWDLIVCGVAVFLGAVIQTGFGIGLGQVAVPIIALARPSLLPATLLLLACPLTLSMAARERSAIDRRGFAWMFLGRVIGSLAGALLVVIADEQSIQSISGGLILGAVIFSIPRGFLPFRRESLIGVGLASGVMGTAAVVGGPPLALLYQDRPAAELRSTLSLIFALGTIFSLLVLWVAGEVHKQHLMAAILFAPAMAAGFLIGRRLTRRLQGSHFRIGILLFSGLGGVAALMQGLLS